MIYLFEAIWCAISLLFQICWLPALIIIVIVFIARIIGKISRESKK